MATIAATEAREASCTESVIRGPAGQLQLLTYRGAGTRPGPLLVLPNGYGLLGYVRSLCRVLSRTWSHVYAPNLRGQGPSDGELSVPGGAADIVTLLSELPHSAGGAKYTLLVHCTSILHLLEIPPTDPAWSCVSRVVLYSYLAKPHEHLVRFRRKARRYGVRLADDLGDLRKVCPKQYAKLPVPLGIVHPVTPTSIRRASLQELEELRQTVHPFAVSTPKIGYRIANQAQTKSVETVVTHDYLPMLRGLDGVPIPPQSPQSHVS